MMKEELVSVVSKYMEIDDENFQLQIDALENKTVLNLSIPVTRPKTDDEIDEAIKEQSLKNQKKAEEIVKELEGLIKEKAMALADGEEIDSELIEKAQKNIEEKDEETTEENTKEKEESKEADNSIEEKEAEEVPDTSKKTRKKK